jgi:8-oxo-dGTP pyrophosphatase MutT (NUDIX family)
VEWVVHGEQVLYESEWMNLALADVEVPGGDRFPHHVMRMPREAAGALVHDPDRGVLMLWRHRFITDEWGWEIPGGRLDPDESPEAAAARECVEETGWQPGPMRHLASFAPASGVSDLRFHVFAAHRATEVGPPADPTESERIEWLPYDEVRDLVARGEVRESLSLVALLWAFAFGTG